MLALVEFINEKLGKNPELVRNYILMFATFFGIFALFARYGVAMAAVSQAKTAHRGNVSDRFSGAISSLMDEQNSVRLGAVHVLERISKENEDYHCSIMDNLAAHVRRMAQRDDKVDSKGGLALDVQEALRVLGDRSKKSRKQDKAKGKGKGWVLDLSDTDFKEVALRGANFDGANLRRANLSKCDLQGASLQRADLSEAILVSVNLKGSKLERANLREAKLQFSNLREACFTEANLWRADLTASSLGGAVFRHALLWGADFRGASMIGVKLEGALLGEADLTGATTRVEDFEGASGIAAIGWPEHGNEMR